MAGISSAIFSGLIVIHPYSLSKIGISPVNLAMDLCLKWGMQNSQNSTEYGTRHGIQHRNFAVHLTKVFVGIGCQYSGRYVDSSRSEEYEKTVHGAIMQGTYFSNTILMCIRYAEDLLLLRTSGQGLTSFPLCLCDNCTN